MFTQACIQLKRLVVTYGKGLPEAVRALLEVGLPDCERVQRDVQQVLALFLVKEQAARERQLEARLKDIQNPAVFIKVASLLAVNFESLLGTLVKILRHQLVEEEGLKRLIEMKLKDASNPTLREGYQELQGLNLLAQGQRQPNAIDASADTPEPKRPSPVKEEPLSAQPFQVKEGTRIGDSDWTLTELLGRGGMGSVWRAENHFSEPGALKLMLPDLVSNARLIERFRLEILSLKKVHHPNIVQLIDWGRDRSHGGELWYFVTEFIQGKPLASILQRNGPLSEELTQKIFIKLAHGLAAAHEQGVIHRDIKPGNIMVRPNGEPVLIDFGIARKLEDPSITKTHERVLTLQFASPEQLYGEEVSPRSDVFSLAATLMFALSPDPKRSRPRYEASLVPPTYQWILEQSLSYQGEKRPQDMIAFAALLEEIRFEDGVAVDYPRRSGGGGTNSLSGALEASAQLNMQSIDGKSSPLQGFTGISPQLLSEERFHYHGPAGQQHLAFGEIIAAIKSSPKARHLLWRKGWSEWKNWYKVDLFKDYIQALREEREQTAIGVQSALKPYEKQEITVHGYVHQFIFLPPGDFWMGSSQASAESDEKPRHHVLLSRGFLLGETTITQEFYQALHGKNPSSHHNPSHPVEQVSWLDAIRWCNLLSENESLSVAYYIDGDDRDPKVTWDQNSEGYRLPTEAEWEYAAKAGNELIYSGSNRPDEVAWFGSHRKGLGQRTWPVSQKQPNAWGFYDLSGNVSEWVWDDMRSYRAAEVRDPVGGSQGDQRVCRGGSSYRDARQTRTTYRLRCRLSQRSPLIGFRVARSVF